jgi:hypothetical protein
MLLIFKEGATEPQAAKHATEVWMMESFDLRAPVGSLMRSLKISVNTLVCFEWGRTCVEVDLGEVSQLIRTFRALNISLA